MSINSFLKRSRRKRKSHGGPSGKPLPTLIWTLDFETDPFLFGRCVAPFACDIFDGEKHYTFWGDSCVDELIAFLHRQKRKIIIYAHNGGRFDFMFLRKWIRGNLLFIGSRLVRGEFSKKIEFRDSYSCLPVPLKQLDKKDISYALMEREVREEHRTEIVEYLQSDTAYLRKWILEWREEFGDKLTMASASMTKFKEYPYGIEHMVPHNDAVIRPYYFGGRVECLCGAGEFTGPLKLYDVNSQYPAAMKNFMHPTSGVPIVTQTIGPRTFFVDVEGHNYGAFITESKGTFRYDIPYGRFKVSIHEYNTALELGRFKPTRIHAALNFMTFSNFSEYIDEKYALRLKAALEGNDSMFLFRKLEMNSCYGKWGQNPLNYTEKIVIDDMDLDAFDRKGWKIGSFNPVEQWTMFTRPAVRENQFQSGFFNVAVSASITGAARSVMLRGLHNAKSPIYCDTDSIFCEELTGVEIHDSNLGAWKVEAKGNYMAVGGKKLYAFKRNDPPTDAKKLAKWKEWKTAKKGARLSGEEIVRIVKGETIEFRSEAPTFNFFAQQMQKPLTRKIRITAR